MAWSTPDLSDITLVLKGLLDHALQTSTLAVANIKTSCDSPETVRLNAGSQCWLTLYMLHVGRDPFWRNTPTSGPRPQLNSAQPLSLNLSYLLTAYCEKDFQLEQRAMSVALAAIQSNAILTQTVIQSDPQSQWLPEGEFVISIEADTIDEMSRLWQAFTVPMRLSALIRASVIFIQPALPPSPPAIPPSDVNLAVGLSTPIETDPLTGNPVPPTLLPGFGQTAPPVIPGTTAVVLTAGPFVAVGGNPAVTDPRAALGSTLAILGNALDLSDAANVYLSVPGTGPEWDITIPWRQPGTAVQLNLQLPASYAAPGSTPPIAATEAPPPGIYNLAVGSGTLRSNTIPIMIAPRVDGVTNPPQLTGTVTTLYAISGAGFVPASTALTVGTAILTRSSSASPATGKFYVNPAGTAISFKLPTATTAGSYPILLTVNGIPASTGWVVVVVP